ncbi:MAG: hypothetical protein E7400_06255 [Ruminococcaceae bacterium]|nr:hypothetical protein [Oscillospiraceae bacterium]
MKKVVKSLVAVSVLVVMVLSLSGCSTLNKLLNSHIDYDKMIESYVPDHFNDITLSVGDVDGPGARVWLESKLGSVYTSDESVVTISDLGKVTAVGPGTAYVVITGPTGLLFEVYRYTVQ